MTTGSMAAAVARQLRPGMRVAVADGAGGPYGLAGPLTEAAATVGGISLVLGWCLRPPVCFEAGAFSDVRAVMGGFALRAPIRDGVVRYVPARYGSLPALLTGALRPDVLVMSARRGGAGWVFGTEVGWARCLVDAGVTVLVEENAGLPAATADPGIPLDRAVLVARTERAPVALPSPPVDPVSAVLGERVAALVPEGAAVQYGPGAVGEAVLAALTVPVRVVTGMLTDAAVGLAERGLLLGDPRTGYLAGTQRLYDWADGRPLAVRVEESHDICALAREAFVSVNTALEIDTSGQVNVQTSGDGVPVAGIGGHSDFCLAGARSVDGLSVVATPSRRGGRPVLAERLRGPASTPRSDVDVVVTELGTADLRGLDDRERGAELRRVFGAVAPEAEP